jgi:hypothetical protein
MDAGALVTLGYNRSEVFANTYLPIYKGYWVQRCIVFNPYSNVTPSIQGQASYSLLDA